METQKVEAKTNFLNISLNFELNKEPLPEFKAFSEPEIRDLSCIGKK
jgi:hypothetical protein